MKTPQRDMKERERFVAKREKANPMTTIGRDEARGQMTTVGRDEAQVQVKTRAGTTQRRYQLVIPDELYTELRDAAEERGVPTVHLVKTFIKLGLIALATEKDPDSALILRTKETERQLLLV